LFLEKKDYNHTTIYYSLNAEGKMRWRILKNFTHINKRELEDWGHCWVLQQNVNENTSGPPDVFFQEHNYPRFLELTKQCEFHMKLQMENKTKNVPTVRGQNSSIVTNIDVNINDNANAANDWDNRSSNPSDFVTSSSFVPSTPLNVVTLTNVVPSTPQLLFLHKLR
jgi:hypothetical protein